MYFVTIWALATGAATTPITTASATDARNPFLLSLP